MNDIAPLLLSKIQKDFQNHFDKSEIISKLYEKVRDGTATYAEANDFAIETGNILADAYRKHISSEILPNGRMYYNVASKIVEPTLINNYNLISAVTQQVQKSLNEKADIGLKIIQPELNRDRIDGIVNKVSEAEKYDDVAWVLDEPIKNFSQSIVDDSIKVNAEFHLSVGLNPVITRKVAGDCCEWCKNLAGTYTYPNDVPVEVYRRHQRCRCVVTYNPKDGKSNVQNIHTKAWKSEHDAIVFAERKKIGLQDETKSKNKRIETAQRIKENDLNSMSLQELQELCAETETQYYESGLSGISFGDFDKRKAAEMLAKKQRSRTSLKKDILSMRKKRWKNSINMIQ